MPVITLHFDVLVSPGETKSIHGITAVDPACMAAKMLSIPAIVPFFNNCASQANGPLLTVMVETILYALYAGFFVFLIWRGRERVLGVICLAAYLAGILVAALVSVNPSEPNASLYNWWQNSSVFGFLPYWWAGALAVNSSVRAALNRNFTAITVALIALTVALVGIWYVFHTSYETAVLAQLRQLVFAVWTAALIGRVDGASVGRWNPLPAIGRAGYSLYAFHAPILVCLLIYGVAWPLVLVAVITVGFIMYALIEKPSIFVGKLAAERLKAQHVISVT